MAVGGWPSREEEVMRIVLSRIDNRLLHGVVATQWAPRVGAQRIMVIDDETASNEIAKSSMRLARPAGMAISIISLDTALANFSASKYEDQTIFIITKVPGTLRRLMEGADVPIKEVDVGATEQRDIAEGITEVNRRVTLDGSERDDYRWLIEHGVKVYAQYLPSEKPQPLDEFLQ